MCAGAYLGESGVKFTSRAFFHSSRRGVIVTTTEELEEFAAKTGSCWGGGLFCDRSHRAPVGRDGPAQGSQHGRHEVGYIMRRGEKKGRGKSKVNNQ